MQWYATSHGVSTTGNGYSGMPWTLDSSEVSVFISGRLRRMVSEVFWETLRRFALMEYHAFQFCLALCCILFMHLHGSSSLSCHVCFVCASFHPHVIHVRLTADWHLDCTCVDPFWLSSFDMVAELTLIIMNVTAEQRAQAEAERQRQAEMVQTLFNEVRRLGTQSRATICRKSRG